MRAMKRIVDDSTPVERITASYLEEGIELSDKDEELKKRWEAAFSFLLNFHSREQTVKKLIGVFGGSIARAYRDINNALSLFGDINKSRKEGWRYIIFEYNQTLFQMATKDKDLDIMGRCLDRMIKLADLDKEEGAFNPEKLIAMQIQISLPDSTIKVFKDMNSKGVVDLNNFEAEDTNYTEVSPDE